jgi:signal transduction histidine kinase
MHSREVELSILYEISSIPARLSSLKLIFDMALDKAARVLGAEVAVIYLVEQDTPQLRAQASRGLRLAKVCALLPLNQGEIDLSQQTWTWSPAESQPVAWDPLQGAYPIQAALGLPIRSASGVLGWLYAARLVARPFDEVEVSLFTVLASRIATALENLKQLEMARQQAMRLQIAAEVGRAVTSILDLDQLLPRVVDLIHERFGYYHVGVFLTEPGGEAVVLQAASGEAASAITASNFRLPAGESSLVGFVTATGQPKVVQDVTRDPLYQSHPLLPDTRSEAVLPLMIAQTIIGVLDVQSQFPGTFTPEAFLILMTMADQIAVAVQNARLHAAEKERAAELERAYRELKTNQENLLIKEKMAFLGRLTAGVAHEMNTPLAAVRAALAELDKLTHEYEISLGDPTVTLDDYREITREMRQAVQLGQRAAEVSAGFVRSIKSQTRDLAPQERLQFEVAPVIRDSLLLLNYELRRGKCAANLEVTSEPILLHGSPGRLAQAVTNLVVNAIDASAVEDRRSSPEDRSSPQGDSLPGKKGGGLITLRLEATPETITLQVSDQGSGIRPEALPKIFDPLFTTKPFGKGTGLGLTIVHDIVTGDFGGTIEVTSQLGQGTTFILRFPQPS